MHVCMPAVSRPEPPPKLAHEALDCFAEPVLGPAKPDPWDHHDEKKFALPIECPLLFLNCSIMTTAPIPEMSEEEFNAKLAKNVAESAVYMKTLEQARLSTAGLRETNDAVEDLRRLREILMGHVERTDRQARSLLRLDEWEAADKSIDPGMKCIKLARAVRLSIVLQQELLGLRPAPGVRMPAAKEADEREAAQDAPEREADGLRRETDSEREILRDRDDTRDYDDRSYGEVIEAIRAEFKIPAGAKQALKSGAAIPADMPEPHIAALAGAKTPAAFRREHGPP